MTQPFTDALMWVPKSRALSATLARANDLARAQGHAAVTLEHMLSALIEDPDASAVLLACSVDLLQLNGAVNTHLQQQPATGAGAPEAAPAVLAILEYAVAAARQSKRSEVNGAIVLAATVGEGNSVAARMLQAQGLTFEGAVQALKRTSSQPMRPTASAAPPPVAPRSPAAESTASAVTPPPVLDEDPVTTARRRIEAMRAGQSMPPIAPPAPAPTPSPQMAMPTPVPSPPTTPAVESVSTKAPMPAVEQAVNNAWAPPPIPAQPAAPARPPRMPPPIPPLASPPPRTSGPSLSTAQATAPWTDPSSSRPEPASATVIPFPANRAGMPIDPARLIDRLPKVMKVGVATTVEVRIARSAVHATATAMGAAPDAALTRALAVRLKAPSGGFHVETAAPETQWFDVRNTGRDDEEVRWRWIVTPNKSGDHPLQLGIAIRTLASDGVTIETTLPEQQVTARAVLPLVSVLITGATLGAAALGGAIAMFLASGGFGSIMRAFG